LADRIHPASPSSPGRSAELRRLGLLDGPPDDALNAIVKAAAELFSAPSAVLAVLDENRFWFKARYGLEAAESPRDSTFSSIVAGQDAPLFVADTSSEPRWASLRSVAPPDSVRFYAGVPLRARSGAILGALCAFDQQPRPESAATLVPVLEGLAKAVCAVVEMVPGQALGQLRFEAELRLRDRALAACSSGIVIADARLPDAPVIYCNPAFERMTGYGRDEVAGLNGRFLQGAGTDPAAVAQLHDAIQTGEGTQLILRNYRKDGTPFWNDLTISPVHDATGTLTHFIGVQNDISGRIERVRELRQLSGLQRAILDSASFPLVATATNGVIVAMNETARKLLRLKPGEPLPVEVASLFDAGELAKRAEELSSSLGQLIPAGVAALFTPTRDGNIEEREWTWIASDGRRIPVLLSCSAIRGASDEITGFLLSGIDLSERRTILGELQRLAAVVESASDFIGISTLKGPVLYVNRAGRRMLGLPDTGPLPSSRMFRYVTPETLELIRRTVNPLVRRGERWEGPCTVRHFATNEIVETEGSCFPVPGRFSGEHVCLAAVLRNVTREHRALRALTHSEHRFSDVVGASGEVVWEVGPDLTFTYVSDRVVDLLGYEPAELVGHDALRLFHPDDAKRTAESWARDLSAHRPFRNREYRAIHKDGSVVWLCVAGVPVFHEDGSLASYRGVCLDVTGSRRTQLELEAAKEAAEEAARAKSLFLANMSHEIRTPLSGIIGMANILLDSTLTASQRECVETVRNSGEALLGILNDILDISAIESGRMEIVAQRFDLHQCVTDSVNLFQPGAAGKGIAISLEMGAEVPANVVGDSLHIRQILNKLIGNALKFAGPCEVRVKVTAQTGDRDGWILRFDVTDTGVGIPADRIERLFKAFSQVDSSSVRQHGGVGLGLAIGKRLAELMGGTMWVRSAPGSGSTFSFTVRTGEHAPSSQADSAPAVHFAFDPGLALRHPLRILVAEDNPVNQKIALFLLRKLGYAADLAANGREVLERLRTDAYDLILLDIQMPGMDGLQTARAVREKFGHPDRPWLVALTANAMADDRREAEEAGMNDYLSKPVQGAELHSAIERAAEALRAGRNEAQPAVWELPEGLREVLDADAKEIIHEILDLYLQDSEPLTGEILAAHAAQDGDALGRLLHRLKGSSAQVGALRLSSLCLQAESELLASGPAASSLGACLGQMAEAWEQAAIAIRQWLGPSARPLDAPTSPGS
jgi:PAS domain S-box-containing protein